jgi:hypothetical protein
MGAGLFGIILVLKLSQPGIGPFGPDKAVLLILFFLFSFWGLRRNTSPGLILLAFLVFLVMVNVLLGLI